MGQVEGRQLLPSETHEVRTAQHLVAKDLDGDRRRRAKARKELLDERGALTGDARAQVRERLLIVGGGQCIEPAGQLANRLVPGELLVLAVAACAASFERPGDAIWVEGSLNRALA